MKKKLLLALAIMSLLVCVFAISVFAETTIVTSASDEYGTVNVVEGFDYSTKLSLEQRMVLDNGDGTYSTYPSAYALDYNKDGNKRGERFQHFDLTNLSNATGYNYTHASVIRYEIPEGITIIHHDDRSNINFNNCDNMIEVVFPSTLKTFTKSGLLNDVTELVSVDMSKCVNLTSMPSTTFANCAKLTSVILPNNLTSIPKETFYNCTSFTGVENWDEIKNNITTIGEKAFYNCDALVSIALPNVSSMGSHAFQNCAELTTVDLIGSSFVKLNSAFRGCPKLDGIVLPDTVDSISQDGFNGCKALSSIVIPRDCTSIGSYGFSGCSSLVVIDMSKAVNLKSTGQNSFSGVPVKELHFPEGFQTFGGIYSSDLEAITFPNSTTSIGILKGKFTEFVVPLGVTSLGSKQFDHSATLEKLVLHKGITSMVIGNNPSFFNTGVNNIYYTGTEDDDFYKTLVSVKPNATYYFVDQCEIYFGTHAWSGNVEMQAVDYFKGVFFADVCTRDFCGVNDIDDSKTIGAIFVSYGYSMTEVEIGGKLSMSQFFGIDKTNLEKYTTLTGNAFEYGFVVSSNADPLNEANKSLIAEGKTYITTQNGFKHDYFAVAVAGFTDATVDNALTFCVYVKDGNKISYLDNGETVETVNMKSYNQIKALLGK